MKVAITIVVAIATALLVAQNAFEQSSEELLGERRRIETRLRELAAIAPATGIGPSDPNDAATGDASAA